MWYKIIPSAGIKIQMESEYRKQNYELYDFFLKLNKKILEIYYWRLIIFELFLSISMYISTFFFYIFPKNENLQFCIYFKCKKLRLIIKIIKLVETNIIIKNIKKILLVQTIVFVIKKIIKKTVHFRLISRKFISIIFLIKVIQSISYLQIHFY